MLATNGEQVVRCFRCFHDAGKKEGMESDRVVCTHRARLKKVVRWALKLINWFSSSSRVCCWDRDLHCRIRMIRLSTNKKKRWGAYCWNDCVVGRGWDHLRKSYTRFWYFWEIQTITLHPSTIYVTFQLLPQQRMTNDLNLDSSFVVVDDDRPKASSPLSKTVGSKAKPVSLDVTFWSFWPAHFLIRGGNFIHPRTYPIPLDLYPLTPMTGLLEVLEDV